MLFAKRGQPLLSNNAPASASRAKEEAPLGALLRQGPPAVVLGIGGLGLIGLIAVCDLAAGPKISFGLFYLVPIAAGAWWGGLPNGVLLSLVAALAWHLVDIGEDPTQHPVLGLWNWIVHFGTFTAISSLLSRLRTAMLREHQLARTDPLTGAANGRTLYERVAQEAERAHRQNRPLTLVYLDLDHFKQLNDRLGHAVGDAALTHLAHCVRQTVRASDTLARIGGDEFVLLLPDTAGPAAVALLNRLREFVAAEMARRGWPLTISVGAATFHRPCADVDVMIQRVDALMYASKRRGKDRIHHEVIQTLPDLVIDHDSLERRARMRILCNTMTRIRVEGADEKGGFATVMNISVSGVGLRLEDRLPDNTILVVEPFSEFGAKTLLARVRWTKPESGGWYHGCELSPPLNDEEISRWAGKPSALTVP